MSSREDGPIRVLVVDDAPDLRELVMETLGPDEAFAVVGEAGDGIEAVELAGTLQPDLIVLDVAMPRMDGVTALPLLKEAAPQARVVMLTGLARAPLEEQTRARGAVGFIEKGTPAREFVQELRTVVGLLEAVAVALDEVRRPLPVDPRSPATARRTVVEALRRWGCDEGLDDAALLVSELVTNAVVHAGTAAEVAVRMLPDRVRIEVADDAPGFGVPEDVAGDAGRRPADESGYESGHEPAHESGHEPAHESGHEPGHESGHEPGHEPGHESGHESGRGLEIVAALASAWGVAPGSTGKVVWFEVPRPGAALDGRTIR